MSAKPPSFTVIFEKPAVWLVIVLTLFAVPLYFSFRSPQPTLPPVLGQVPDFKLTNQDGRDVTYNTEFRGGVLLVNFIFTSCPDVCPLLSKQMAKIQERLVTAAPIIRLASISVDPGTDTPAVLKAYGDKYGARYQNWSFLTGDLMQIYDTVVGGFKIAMDNAKVKPPQLPELKATPGPGPSVAGAAPTVAAPTVAAPTVAAPPSKDQVNMDLMQVTHGEHFVLVDQIGQIRAYMQASNDDQINQIVKTLGILANTNPLNASRPPDMTR